MSEKEYAKMTVNLLKEELRKRGLEQTGKKADLVSRLEAHDAALKDDQMNNSILPAVSCSDDSSTEKCDDKDVPTAVGEHASGGEGSLGQAKLFQADEPEIEAAEVEESKVGKPEVESSVVETLVVEVPVVEVPVVETSEVEAPEVEAPVVEASKVEVPVVETSEVEAPVVEASEIEISGIEAAGIKVEVLKIEADQVQYKGTQEGKPENIESSIQCIDAKNTFDQSICSDKAFLHKGPSLKEEEAGDRIEIISSSTSNVDASETFGESSKVSSADDDLHISNLFGIEMKRERDAFQLKWYGQRFTVPFIGDIIRDLAAEISQRSFVVKSVTMDDIQSSCFQEVISTAAKFLLNFQENVLEPSQPGFAKFVFKSNEDCLKFKESLKFYKSNLTIENISFDEQLNQQFLNKDAIYCKGTIVDRLLYVGNLPCDVAECTVMDLFPDALRVIFPPLKDLDESINSVRYVYVEYQTSDDVIAIAEKCKELKLNGERLFVIKALCVKKERFGLLTDKLRSILLEKVRKMKKIQKNPWNKSRQEMQEIDKTISMNMEKLITDSKHRKNWGMELGALDESRLEQIELEKIDSISERGRGHRGGTSRVGSSRPYESRRGHLRSSGFNNSRGWGGLYGSSGYMNSGYSQTGPGGYGHQDPYFNKRKSNDLGGDWKRGRYY